MRRVVFLLAFVLFWTEGSSQTARATLDSTRILVGSPATLWVEVAVPSGTPVRWPNVFVALERLEILRQHSVDTFRSMGGDVYRQRIVLTGLEPGTAGVGTLAFATPAGTLQTAPLSLEVVAVAVDTTQPFLPIKDIMEVPTPWWSYWPYAAALVGVLLTFLLWRMLRRRKDSKPPKPTGDAASRALAELAKLEKTIPTEAGNMKAWYTALADALRRYLEEAHSLRTAELTTAEVVSAAAVIPAVQPHTDALRAVLQESDLVKFAKAFPTSDDARVAVTTARGFVQRTA